MSSQSSKTSPTNSMTVDMEAVNESEAPIRLASAELDRLPNLEEEKRMKEGQDSESDHDDDFGEKLDQPCFGFLFEDGEDDDIFGLMMSSTNGSYTKSTNKKDSKDEKKQNDNGPKLSRTENNAVTYSKTDDACLDLFFQSVPSISRDGLIRHLNDAWKSNPNICLKLIFNLGNVRKDGNGKQDRQNFYRALLWLAKHQPQTFLRNLAMIPRHASLKCLLNIVMLVIHEQYIGGEVELITYKSGKKVKTVANPYTLSGVCESFGNSTATAASKSKGKGKGRNIRKNFKVNRNGNSTKSSGFSGISLTEQQSKMLSKKDAYQQLLLNFALMKKNSETATEREKKMSPEQWLEHERKQQCITTKKGTSATIRKDAWIDSTIRQEFEDYVNKINKDLSSSKGGATEQRRVLRSAIYEKVKTLKETNSFVKEMCERTARIFAKGLKLELMMVQENTDKKMVQENKDKKASNERSVSGLFAKWSPTPGGMHDKATLLAQDIINVMRKYAPEVFVKSELKNQKKMSQKEKSQKKGLNDKESQDKDEEDFEMLSADSDDNSDEDEEPNSKKTQKESTESPPNGQTTSTGVWWTTPEMCAFRVQVLTPIRRAAEVPEHFIATQQWHQVNYSRMASRCRLLFGQKVFRKHDEERYDEYLSRAAKQTLEAGINVDPSTKAKKRGREDDNEEEEEEEKKAKVNVGSLLPHEVISRARQLEGSNNSVYSYYSNFRNNRESNQFDDEKKILEKIEVNLQWRGLVQGVREVFYGAKNDSNANSNFVELGSGSTTNKRTKTSTEKSEQLPNTYWLPMCDVSGSMSGEPMEVAIALSMLLAESCPKSNPWYGRILTFESQPKMMLLDGIPDYDAELNVKHADNKEKLQLLGNVARRAQVVEGYSWGGSTNLEAAFKLLLDRCKKCKLSEEEVANTNMIIFSDMEFDSATTSRYNNSYGGSSSSNSQWWDTTHERMKTMYKNSGYSKLPKIVYWNLRASRGSNNIKSNRGGSIPVGQKTYRDVALLSGFSSGMMKGILKSGLDVEAMTPWAELINMISGTDYEKLVVV